ncbi:MAG: peptidoglycan-binding protein [Halioglobus sp.]|nr:peptidoglycan-binding protein [Halioglobus sp.]
MKLWKAVFVATVLACTSAGQALGDELVQIVQQDLTTLGYDTGPADGEATTKTIIAVSKFQAEHNLEVTGEITPQLAGVIQAAISKQGNSTGSVQVAATAEVTPEQAQADLKARQEACLQEKVEAAQQASKTQSGLGKLFSAVTRSTSQYGSVESVAKINDTASQIYSAGATMGDLKGAAADLGISDSDIDACRNP